MSKDNQASKNLSRHTLSNLLTNIGPMAIALITIPLYLSYIGEERFGVLALILAFLTYFNFMDMGLGRAVSRRIAQLQDSEPSLKSNALWTTIISSVILGIFGGLILWVALDFLLQTKVEMSSQIRLETNAAIIYLAMSLPLLLPISSFVGALHATLNFKQSNFVMLVSNCFVQILPCVAAYFGLINLETLVKITLVVKILSSIALFCVCISLVPLRTKPVFDKNEFKNMLSYGGWVSVIGLITPLLTTIDRVLIASLSGAKYLTYYVIPYDLVTKIMIIPGSFSSALFPRLVSGSIDESYNMAISATKTLIAIMTPITIIGLLLIEEFVSLWVGESIAEKSKFIGEILLIGLWVNALVIPTYSRHLARRNPKTIVFIFLFEIPVFLLLLYFGLKFYGIQGAAIAWTLRVCLDTFLILKVNNIFKDIVLTNYLSGIITLAALLLYLLETNLIISFLLSSLLLLVSLVKDKVLLMTTYKELVM